MRKRLLVLIAALTLTLPTATPVAADGFDLSPDNCGFPIHLEILQNNGQARTITDRQGAPRFTLTSGVLKVQLTNLTTGQSIELNVSGPGRFNATRTILSTQGTWLIYLDTGPVPGAPSRLFLVTGRAEMAVDASGNATSFQLLSGYTENLCPRLA